MTRVLFKQSNNRNINFIVVKTCFSLRNLINTTKILAKKIKFMHKTIFLLQETRITKQTKYDLFSKLHANLVN